MDARPRRNPGIRTTSAEHLENVFKPIPSEMMFELGNQLNRSLETPSNDPLYDQSNTATNETRSNPR